VKKAVVPVKKVLIPIPVVKKAAVPKKRIPTIVPTVPRIVPTPVPTVPAGGAAAAVSFLTGPDQEELCGGIIQHRNSRHV
jgi:hypothetical protein